MTARVSLLLILALGMTAVLALACGASTTAQDADSEPKVETVEVGYEVGLRAPEFGMSLLDGSRVTSAGLAEEGTPVFLYFHATY